LGLHGFNICKGKTIRRKRKKPWTPEPGALNKGAQPAKKAIAHKKIKENPKRKEIRRKKRKRGND